MKVEIYPAAIMLLVLNPFQVGQENFKKEFIRKIFQTFIYAMKARLTYIICGIVQNVNGRILYHWRTSKPIVYAKQRVEPGHDRHSIDLLYPATSVICRHSLQ